MSRRSSASSPSSSVKKTRKKRSKLFHLTLHESEESGSIPLSEMRRSDLMVHVKIPGYVRHTEETRDMKMGELRARGRNIIDGMNNFVHLMHGKGLTLDGDFSVRNLVWIPATRQIKVKRIPPESFISFTEKSGKKDYGKIVEVVEHLLKGYNLPTDLKHWISILKTDPFNNMYLVRFHIALKSAAGKVFHYIYLYGLLEQLKLLSDQADKMNKAGKMKGNMKGEAENEYKDKYKAVVMAISAGDTTTNHDWRSDVHRNRFLQQVYDFNRGYYARGIGASPLLTFARHCTQHLMDKSVENLKVLFTYSQIYCMLESLFPGLFHEFQSAMVKEGYEDETLRGAK